MTPPSDPHLDVDRLLAPLERIDFTVPPEAEGERVDVFLSERMTFTSRRVLQDHARRRAVRVGDRTVRASRRLRTGEHVTIDFQKTGRDLSPPTDLELPVIYEDEWILAIDKPAGVPVHPAGDEVARTVLTALCFAAGSGEYRRIPHRLDRETSGLLLVTKTPQAQHELSTAFQRGLVRKLYVAVVHGQMEGSGTIDRPLRRQGYLSVPCGEGEGQAARTEWAVEAAGTTRTRLRLSPRTGRRHQLRAHLSAIGHPIVGDALYGQGAPDSSRLALHAAELELPHPSDGRRLSLSAPPPSDPVFQAASIP